MLQSTGLNTDIDDKDTNAGNQTGLILKPESSTSTNNNKVGVAPSISGTMSNYAKLDLKNLVLPCAHCGKSLKTEEQTKKLLYKNSMYCFDCMMFACRCALPFFHFTDYHRKVNRK
ncbi:hypothetical protein BB559_006263 [Furculomyces boomerangus]|uniref:Uncharacterized protein n=1 Tax=Furculomyces boomerangus TaxID=61424 RepID=A0A2T9Y3W2_9FUNG|nr:hypothetical protein BB559_006263 [Furculomyces boomerangus]